MPGAAPNKGMDMRHAFAVTMPSVVALLLAGHVVAGPRRVALRGDAPARPPGAWPLAAGVPLPKGQVPCASQIRLIDDGGRGVPCQVDVTATWPDGSVRWALVSFSGSTEIMRRLTGLGCYISYSEALVRPQNRRLRDTFIDTAPELVLLETDAPYAKNPARPGDRSAEMINEPGDVAELYRFAARLLHLSTEEICAQIWKNASIFTNQTAAG